MLLSERTNETIQFCVLVCVCVQVEIVNFKRKRRYFERLFITFAFNLRVHTFKTFRIYIRSTNEMPAMSGKKALVSESKNGKCAVLWGFVDIFTYEWKVKHRPAKLALSILWLAPNMKCIWAKKYQLMRLLLLNQ